MRIDIVSCVPQLLESFIANSIVARAITKGVAEVHLHDLHDYADNKHRRTDDYPFGGGGGMVMQVQPIAACFRKLRAERDYDAIIYTSPDGEVFNQGVAHEMVVMQNILILCGHYKGVDERVRELFITREISIGDYVLTGGELAAAVLADAVIRLLPGAIGDEVSALTDSFQDGMLAAPVYTRPAEWEGHSVPEVLLLGHQAHIDAWRFEQQIARTKARRPDLLSD